MSDLDLGGLADAAIARLKGEIRALRERVATLEDGIRTRHRPTDVEVEQYHDDDHFPGELDDDCPDDTGRGCPGHLVTATTCHECGYLADPDFEVAYRPWPCPTVLLLDASHDQEGTDRE